MPYVRHFKQCHCLGKRNLVTYQKKNGRKRKIKDDLFHHGTFERDFSVKIGVNSPL